MRERDRGTKLEDRTQIEVGQQWSQSHYARLTDIIVLSTINIPFCSWD